MASQTAVARKLFCFFRRIVAVVAVYLERRRFGCHPLLENGHGGEQSLHALACHWLMARVKNNSTSLLFGRCSGNVCAVQHNVEIVAGNLSVAGGPVGGFLTLSPWASLTDLLDPLKAEPRVCASQCMRDGRPGHNRVCTCILASAYLGIRY